MIKLVSSNIVTAFSNSTIGTKVTDADNFLVAVEMRVRNHAFNLERVPGQGFIHCNEVIPYVSAGVGKRTKDPNDYVLREHRGTVEAYLSRKHAATVDGCALVVYTVEAYLNDPDVQADSDETARIKSSEATHVLVAVLAFAGPKAPLSPHRLVHNLAGGNKEALTWSADEIRANALESKTYHDEWCTIAD